jgi:hypothetical protein
MTAILAAVAPACFLAAVMIAWAQIKARTGARGRRR